MSGLWIALGAVAAFGCGYFSAARCTGARRWGRTDGASSSARELDRLIVCFQRERARAGELEAWALAAHIDVVIGSLTRMRVALAEGRSIDVDVELAVIVAADERIVREGDASAA